MIKAPWHYQPFILNYKTWKGPNTWLLNKSNRRLIVKDHYVGISVTAPREINSLYDIAIVSDSQFNILGFRLHVDWFYW